MKKRLLAIFLFVTIGSTGTYALSECAAPTQLNGAVFGSNGLIDPAQSLTSGKLWECPSLQNVQLDDNGDYPFTHTLKNIDYKDGTYVCDYSYKETGSYKQSCTFSSVLYKGLKDLAMLKLHGGVDKEGKAIEGLFDKDGDIDLQQFNYLNIPYPPAMLTANRDFNEERKKILQIQSGVNFDPTNPNRRAEIVRQNTRQIVNRNFTNIESDLAKIQDLINRHLIDPYLHPSSSDVRKGYTLSNFVAGLVTLDPEVIRGYNPNSGEILIQDEWKRRAARITVDDNSGIVDQAIKAITDFFSKIFGGSEDQIGEEQMKTAEKIYGGDVQFEIYSYAKVFEEKLWGFYYLLQERFDIGYSILASNLLMFFGIGFIFAAGSTEGLKYLTNQSNYERSMNETGYVKTLLILLTLGFFFVSIPSGISDTPDETGNFEPNRMTKNYTLAKTIIRKTASYGANTATMFSDLGFSAFAQYIVKRQMMLSIKEIQDELEASVDDIYMYSPALDIRKQCQIYYNSPNDAAFFDSIDDANFPVNETWKDSDYAKKKNISALSYDTCKTAYKLYAMMPYQIGHAVATAEERLRKADGKLSEATYLMTYNNVALSEKMGWISAFAYPLEYFILKDHDMFLSEEIDGDRITEESEKYMDTLFKDNDALKRSSFFGDAQDNIAYVGAKAVSLANGYFIYNILPMFSDIQKGLYIYFEKVYESKYQLWVAEKTSNKTSKKMKKFFESVADKIKGVPMIGSFIVIIKGFFGSTIGASTMWHTGLLFLSYQLAIWIWRMTFAIVFVILISMMFLVSFIMYFFDLLVHFTTSLFMFVWAFGSAKSGQGEGKLKEWVKNTILIVYLKPSILIFGGFMFIFLYELMYTLYQIVFTSVTSNLMASISLMSAANSKTGLIDSMGAYTTVMSMKAIAEATLPLFGLYFAYVAILKIPAIVAKKIGADSDDAGHTQSITEHVQSKQERHTNPAT